jgi:predicted metal-dependent HD superfamily phosphohydrolase
MSMREQWIVTWERLGAAAPEGVYEEVIARYAEPHRHYHTVRHLEECFAELAAMRGEAERPGEVELALWFHDAIYDTRRHDNEERSAEWARSVVARAGLDASVGERVAALIMATRHDAVPADANARVLVDVDLSILGAPAVRFDEYERDVRREYAWVPDLVFRRERRKILRSFLERAQIFQTPAMHAAREQRARANLARSVRELRRSGAVYRAVIAVTIVLVILAGLWALRALGAMVGVVLE